MEMIDYIIAVAVVVVPITVLITTGVAIAGYTLIQTVKKKKDK
tara:strand:- start:205 stop:333 length:129 start_codon:yes stop_codon:yes gene_type:complete